jgi:hypothetical protein
MVVQVGLLQQLVVEILKDSVNFGPSEPIRPDCRFNARPKIMYRGVGF